jgi:hypothetical protein
MVLFLLGIGTGVVGGTVVGGGGLVVVVVVVVLGSIVDIAGAKVVSASTSSLAAYTSAEDKHNNRMARRIFQEVGVGKVHNKATRREKQQRPWSEGLTFRVIEKKIRDKVNARNN